MCMGKPNFRAWAESELRFATPESAMAPAGPFNEAITEKDVSSEPSSKPATPIGYGIQTHSNGEFHDSLWEKSAQYDFEKQEPKSKRRWDKWPQHLLIMALLIVVMFRTVR